MTDEPNSRALFRLLGEQLYISKKGLSQAGISENYIDSATSLNRAGKLNAWASTKHQGQRWIEFSTITDQYKNQVLNHYLPNHSGRTLDDLIEYAHLSLLEDHPNYTVPRAKAAEFTEWRQQNDIYLDDLDESRVGEAVKVVNLYQHLKEEHHWKEFYKSSPKFHDAVFSLIKSKGLDQATSQGKPSLLPGSSRANLIRKTRKYQESGIGPAFLSKRGNANASKLGRVKGKTAFCPDTWERQVSAIAALAVRYGNVPDCVMIAQDYNAVAKEAGWFELTPRTIRNYLNDPQIDFHISKKRFGDGYFKSKHLLVVDRERPKSPLAWCEVDGDVLELSYQAVRTNQKGNKETTYHQRLTVVFIYDHYLRYPLGYALGDQETSDLIKNALRDAQYHLKELSGDYHGFGTFRYDSFGTKEIKALYKLISNDPRPAKPNNGREKAIEAWFSSFHKPLKKAKNYSGTNVTSKTQQLNSDYKYLIRKEFPTKAELVEQVSFYVEKWRNQVIDESNQETRIERYKAELNNNPRCQEKIMSREQFLKYFGHDLKERKLTNRGLPITWKGEERLYLNLDTGDPEFQIKNIGLHFSVKYDPADLSSVLAYNPQRGEYLINEKPRVPGAVEERTDADWHTLNRIRALRKSQETLALQGMERYEETVRESLPGVYQELNGEDEFKRLTYTRNGFKQQEQLAEQGTKRKQLPPEEIKDVEAPGLPDDWEKYNVVEADNQVDHEVDGYEDYGAVGT